MGFRIDPIDEKGIFDHNFFTSEEFITERNSLEKYLFVEGFDTKTEQFSITFRNRTWTVKPDSSKSYEK